MTLTDTAALTKKAFVIFIMLIILATLGFVAFKLYTAYKLAHQPIVEEEPTMKYGKLPDLDLPPSNVSSSNYSYSIDTPTGKLPVFEKLVKVYFMPKAAATFLSGDKSKTLAKDLGILTEPQILSETNYKFATDSGQVLDVSIDTGNFKYSHQATLSANQNQMNDETKLVSDFKNMLSRIGVLNEELVGGSSKVSYYKFFAGHLIPASKDGEVAQISLWPADFDKKPIVTGNINKSLVYGIVDKSAKEIENLISLNFTFWPIEKTEFSTYPIKTSEEAFGDLQKGLGKVTEESSSPQVSITDLKIGYFENENYTPYLQPVYIFIGPNFEALVSAVKN